jgi:hypothetical protein
MPIKTFDPDKLTDVQRAVLDAVKDAGGKPVSLYDLSEHPMTEGWPIEIIGFMAGALAQQRLLVVQTWDGDCWLTAPAPY